MVGHMPRCARTLRVAYLDNTLGIGVSDGRGGVRRPPYGPSGPSVAFLTFLGGGVLGLVASRVLGLVASL